MHKNILTLPVGQLQSNCYILKTDTSHAFVIDPGDDADYIIQKLQDNELTLQAILVTHGHYDHLLAALTLQLVFNCPLYISKQDKEIFERMRQTAIHFGESDPGPIPIATFFEKTDFVIPDSAVEIIHSPGHTPGSVCFYDRAHASLFCGDLVFADGSVGETTHTYSDKNKLKKSLQKIFELPLETTVYPGHGEEISLEELKAKSGWALI